MELIAMAVLLAVSVGLGLGGARVTVSALFFFLRPEPHG
jgi:hypothetical protein